MFARHEAQAAELPGVNGIVGGLGARRAGGAVRRRARVARVQRRDARPRRCSRNSAAPRAMRRLDEPGRARLRTLVPRLLASIADARRRCAAGRRPAARAQGPRGDRPALRLLRAAERERAACAARLVELAALGEFLAAQIASHPLLLDELLDESAGAACRRRARRSSTRSTARLEHLDEDEPERQVEVLRQFQRAAIFRVAMADLTGKIPLMQVSDYLTEIAEIIVEQAMRLGWQQMTAQFGVPHDAATRRGAPRREHLRRRLRQARRQRARLRLRSRSRVPARLAAPSRPETDAAKPVDNQVFFIRFAQRVVHLLTMHSAAGRLYEVDVRLRPSGKGGMLITRIGAFAEYQEKEAWTWEHQALLHARAVAGDARAARGVRARARRGPAQPRAPRHAARRGAQHARAHAQGAVAGQGRLRQVRPQAGCRRHRRHRVPGAVLGAAACAGRIRRS